MQRCFDLEVLSHAKIAPATLAFGFIHLAGHYFYYPDRKRNLKCAAEQEFPSKRDFGKEMEVGAFSRSPTFSGNSGKKGQKQCACNQRKREQSFGP